MVRRISPSQYRSQLRQLQTKVRNIQQKRKHAIDQYNRDVRCHNQEVRRRVDNYNREVRAYNSRVRANRQRLANELSRLRAKPTPKVYTHFRTTVNAVQTAYERVETRAARGDYDERYNEFLDLSEREAANNASVMNAILSEDMPEADDSDLNQSDESVLAFLSSISKDLLDRWRGALYSLNPNNPDAARHFCTSAREVITQILETKAPDEAVQSALPDCDLTQNGKPTRRSKVRYFLKLKGFSDETLEEFIETDLNNVVELFHVFNHGTHGPAGKFSFVQLQAIKKRVEDGLGFLGNLMS